VLVHHAEPQGGITVIEYGLALGMEREMADLKGLISPDSFCESEDAEGGLCLLDTELELLGALNDPAIKVLRDTLEKFRVCAMNYRIIIGLDIEELVTVCQLKYENDRGL
jgi:hypothetical protein